MPAARIFTPGTRALATPQFRPPQPRSGQLFRVSGVTKDSTGAVLPACTVHLFRTATDVLVDQTVSDGSGAYAFPNVTAADQHYVVAYLAGATDVAGTTVNTVVGAGA